MQVQHIVNLGEGHSIEFGQATWNSEAMSIRNRYTTSNGGFSPHSSSELPIEDVSLIVLETLRRDLFSIAETMDIAQGALESIRRRLTDTE